MKKEKCGICGTMHAENVCPKCGAERVITDGRKTRNALKAAKECKGCSNEFNQTCYKCKTCKRYFLWSDNYEVN